MADKWPDWAKPATKGDVVRGIVHTRSCLVDIFVCLSALHREDMEKFQEAFEQLRKNDAYLKTVIDEIGGRKNGE